MRFCSELLGEINETFIWELKGQPEPLPLVLKGRVVGPQFHFSCPKDGIEFGTVSLGFLNERSFFLNNTAEIPMRYRLRIPDVDGAPHKEFVVTHGYGHCAAARHTGAKARVHLEGRPKVLPCDVD